MGLNLDTVRRVFETRFCLLVVAGMRLSRGKLGTKEKCCLVSTPAREGNTNSL